MGSLTSPADRARRRALRSGGGDSPRGGRRGRDRHGLPRQERTNRLQRPDRLAGARQPRRQRPGPARNTQGRPTSSSARPSHPTAARSRIRKSGTIRTSTRFGPTGAISGRSRSPADRTSTRRGRATGARSRSRRTGTELGHLRRERRRLGARATGRHRARREGSGLVDDGQDRLHRRVGKPLDARSGS